MSPAPDDQPVDYSEILKEQPVSNFTPPLAWGATVEPQEPLVSSETFDSIFGPNVKPSIEGALDELVHLSGSYDAMLRLMEEKLGGLVGPPHSVGLEGIRNLFGWKAYLAENPEKGTGVYSQLVDFINHQHGILAKMIHLLSQVQVGSSLKSILENDPGILKGLMGEE